MKCTTAMLALGWATLALSAAERHVSVNGNDHNDGSPARPFKSISAAAQAAQPGDIITVHEGTYRERVNPPRGGLSDAQRIVYRAAPGETVAIKGSEVITGWVKVQDDVWKVTLPNTFFGNFNPYTNVIRGDWFNPLGRVHHTGAVYLNGDWLTEAATLDEVLLPSGQKPAWVTAPGRTLNPNLWFAQVDDSHTTLWAQFPGVNPNQQRVEINVRQSVFYPDQPGRNYITVRGFTLCHAATPWAPPTAEQIGLIGTHWSRGWIIESNVVSHSICCGITLGKHGDQYDNTSANTAEGYVKTIERAHAFHIPWTREQIGHHIVRYNTISHCEQAGIVGSLGPAFSLVEGNVIHDIHVRRLFSGAEMAGIKFHAAIDTVIRGNHIYRANMGLWLDWMAQGTRVARNLFHDNAGQDVFVEVDHGPFLLDNNLFLSPTSLLDMSEGGAYVHNLFAGKINSRPEPGRQTPYHPAHSTTVAGLKTIQGGDDRFYNNLFIGAGATAAGAAFYDPKSDRAVGFGLWVYDTRPYPLQTGGNVYFNGARPYTNEVNALVLPDFDPRPQVVEADGRVYLELSLPPALRGARTKLVTTERLGKTLVAGLPYENADGSPLRIDRDYGGKPRSRTRPSAGPFEKPGAGRLRLKVW